MESFKCTQDSNCCLQKHIDVLNSKEVFTVKEVCRFLGISPRSLYRAIEIKLINSIKIGGSIRIPTKNLIHLTYCDNEVYSLKQACQTLQVSDYIIKNLIKQDKLKSMQIFKRTLIPKAEVFKLIKI